MREKLIKTHKENIKNLINTLAQYLQENGYKVVLNDCYTTIIHTDFNLEYFQTIKIISVEKTKHSILITYADEDGENKHTDPIELFSYDEMYNILCAIAINK